jgi:hypothetical protein
MDDRTAPEPYEYDPLAALGRQLAMRDLTIDHMLHVAAPDASATITCRPRPEDDDRLWFWLGAEPLAEADPDHMDDAVLHVLGHLSERAARTAEASS